ncbi:MAG: chitobiase/beta-hexosaminidase C-terminal domain-containing protein [Eubacteriales bacterium]
MKTRISAFLLIAVMLFGALSMTVSAAPMPTLQSYITNVQATNPTGEVIIALPSDTQVNTATTIPVNISVYVGPDVKLYVSAPLTVYGELRSAIPSNIIISTGGSVTYGTAPNATLQSYITSALAANPTGEIFIALPGNTVVDTATVIPSRVTVYVGPGSILYVYAPVTVYGELHTINASNIVIFQGGSITYGTAPIATLQSYITSALAANPTGEVFIALPGDTVVDTATVIPSNVTVYVGPGSTLYVYAAVTVYGELNTINAANIVIFQGGSVTYNTAPYIPGYYPYYPNYPYYPYYPNYPYYPYEYNYVYIPGYGWIATNATCAVPTASISGGTTVDAGTKVSLTTITPGAVIYYTVNGTAPNTTSIKYTEPISITKDVTIHAVAVHPYIYNSPVAKFVYKIKVSTAGSSYKDISSYPGLAASLDKLIAKKVISTSAAFNPSGSISWNDVSSWFTALGVKVTNANIKPETAFADAKKLTYEEMVLTCYKIMRADKLIAAPRNQGSVTIKKLTYSADITTTAIYKAAYASLIENKVLYGLSFKPQDPANRAYLATAVAWASSKVK